MAGWRSLRLAMAGVQVLTLWLSRERTARHPRPAGAADAGVQVEVRATAGGFPTGDAWEVDKVAVGPRHAGGSRGPRRCHLPPRGRTAARAAGRGRPPPSSRPRSRAAWSRTRRRDRAGAAEGQVGEDSGPGPRLPRLDVPALARRGGRWGRNSGGLPDHDFFDEGPRRFRSVLCWLENDSNGDNTSRGRRQPSAADAVDGKVASTAARLSPGGGRPRPQSVGPGYEAARGPDDQVREPQNRGWPCWVVLTVGNRGWEPHVRMKRRSPSPGSRRAARRGDPSPADCGAGIGLQEHSGATNGTDRGGGGDVTRRSGGRYVVLPSQDSRRAAIR